MLVVASTRVDMHSLMWTGRLDLAEGPHINALDFQMQKRWQMQKCRGKR